MKNLLLILSFLGLMSLGAACNQSASETQLDPLAERCSLVPDPGRCKARMERYFYDPESQSCQVFYWGGCGGVVPFETLADCQQACEGK